MEKAKRVFAVLGLIWVIDILFYLIFPGTWLTWYTYSENFVHLLGASSGSRESFVLLLPFRMVPAFLVVFAGIGVQS